MPAERHRIAGPFGYGCRCLWSIVGIIGDQGAVVEVSSLGQGVQVDALVRLMAPDDVQPR